MAPPRTRTSRSPWHPHPPQPWELGNSGVREAPPRPPPPAPSPASLRDLFRWLDALDLHGDDRLSPPHADFRAGFARAFADGVLAAEVVHKALARQRVRIGRFPILEHSNGRTKMRANWRSLEAMVLSGSLGITLAADIIEGLVSGDEGVAETVLLDVKAAAEGQRNASPASARRRAAAHDRRAHELSAALRAWRRDRRRQAQRTRKSVQDAWR